MVFNEASEASHVWLFSRAFSCLVNCQDVRGPLPKNNLCDSASVSAKQRILWRL